VLFRSIELGVGVSKPISPLPYDLVFEVGKALMRVQCKWAVFRSGTVEVRCRRCRRGPQGLIHRRYEDGAVDAFAAYCHALSRCFFIPSDVIAGRVAVQLRVARTRNNQLSLINWADDFAFDATLGALLGP